MSTGPPLLLVGHGTRSDAGVAEFTRFVGQVRARTPGLVPAADGGFIELARPSVADAVARLVAPGAGGPQAIVAVPLVLTAAGHGKGDIPAALARELARHPGLSCCYGRPLGPHPALQDIVAARIDDVLAGAPRRGTPPGLARRGGPPPGAHAPVAHGGRAPSGGRGWRRGGVVLFFPAAPALA